MGHDEKLTDIFKNGVTIGTRLHFDPAYEVEPGDIIFFKGQKVPEECPNTEIVLFYKPRGMLTTHKDPFGRLSLQTIIKKLGTAFKSVGRLDKESEGLLILTNNASLKRHLELPLNHIKRTYCVGYRGI